MTKDEAIARLKEGEPFSEIYDKEWEDALQMAIEALEQSGPRWIPCSERMPEEPFGCLVTVWDTEPFTMTEFENILPYFVGWDGERWNDADGEEGPFEVIAWIPLPKAYKEEETND